MDLQADHQGAVRQAKRTKEFDTLPAQEKGLISALPGVEAVDWSHELVAANKVGRCNKSKPVLNAPGWFQRLNSNTIDCFQVLLSNSTCAATTRCRSAPSCRTARTAAPSRRSGWCGSRQGLAEVAQNMSFDTI